MPVMLTPEQFEAWLDPRVTSLEELAPLLRPPPAAALSALAVGPRVNRVRHDDPACLVAAGPPEGRDEPQLSLGI
jgi:putative SOS response-associated peptidase YedK